jgi:hypothetical protein
MAIARPAFGKRLEQAIDQAMGGAGSNRLVADTPSPLGYENDLHN